MRFVRTLARGRSEATPARALFSVIVVVGAVAALVIALVFLVYALA